MELAVRLFRLAIIPKSVVVGEGVEVSDMTEAAAPEAVRFPFGDAPYVLALGRKEQGKNSHLLLAAFRMFKARRAGSRFWKTTRRRCAPATGSTLLLA